MRKKMDDPNLFLFKQEYNKHCGQTPWFVPFIVSQGVGRCAHIGDTL